jgi:uncharacterized membrane protein YeaQ/YmgE (transglycosylase-associated protein family)
MPPGCFGFTWLRNTLHEKIFERRSIFHDAGAARTTATHDRNGRKRMGILSWIIVGLVAGVLAKMVVPGEGPGGIIGDMIVGIVGAFIGGWIFNFFGHTGLDGFTLWSVIVAFVGSVVLLFILRALTGGRRTVV